MFVFVIAQSALNLGAQNIIPYSNRSDYHFKPESLCKQPHGLNECKRLRGSLTKFYLNTTN